jgi:hypothetical protein
LNRRPRDYDSPYKSIISIGFGRIDYIVGSLFINGLAK